MNMQQQAPVQIPPEQLITITLQAQYWQIIMNALQEMPYRIANPVVQALSEQFTKTLAEPPASFVGNGIDHEIPQT